MKSTLIKILQYYRASKHKIKMLRANKWRIETHLQPTEQLHKEWHGTIYGGFYVHPDILKQNDCVVSIGIGKDISFDRSLINKYKVQVFAFDPTPKSIEWLENQKNLPVGFKYFNFGISADCDGKMTFFLPKDSKAVSASLQLSSVMSESNSIQVEMRTFKSLVSILPTKKISILKMDIEGAEYDVLETIFDDPEVKIDQILVEFHDRMFETEIPMSIKSVAFLKEKGYMIFGASISSEEISFIHHSVL